MLKESSSPGLIECSNDVTVIRDPAFVLGGGAFVEVGETVAPRA
jgi:hypothetical protein